MTSYFCVFSTLNCLGAEICHTNTLDLLIIHKLNIILCIYLTCLPELLFKIFYLHIKGNSDSDRLIDRSILGCRRLVLKCGILMHK